MFGKSEFLGTSFLLRLSKKSSEPIWDEYRLSQLGSEVLFVNRYVFV